MSSMEPDSTERPTPNAPLKTKTCDICQTRFARSEHLLRHRRTHTNEKPFTCPCCSLSFRRADVRKLHLERCHGEDTQTRYLLENEHGGSARKRVRIACDSCRRRKTRCSGRQPCPSCETTGLPCIYSETPDESSPGKPERRHQTRSAASPPGQPISPTPSADADADATSKTNQSTTESGQLNTTMQWGSISSFDNPGLPQPATGDADNTTAALDVDMSGCLNVPYQSNELSGSQVGAMFGSYNVLDQDPMTIWFGGAGYQTYGYSDRFSPTFLSGAWMDTSLGPLDIDGTMMLDNLATTIPPRLMPSVDGHLQGTSPVNFPSFLSIIHKYLKQPSSSSRPVDGDNIRGKSWFPDPPNLAIYDKQIINIFLSLMRRHIPPTFSLFEDLDLDEGCDAEYVLALAAVGGLYCTVPGSYKVARAMYNDSRRLLLTKFNCSIPDNDLPTDPKEWLMIAKTSILLEIYGFCSGDRRSDEFTEAYHGHLLEAVQHYAHLSEVDSRDQNTDAKILESILVLDMYRVLIARRPTALSRSYVEMLYPLKREKEDGHTSKADIVDIIHWILTPGQSIPLSDIKAYSLSSLAALSSYLSALVCQSRSSAITGRPSPPRLDRLGKRDFVTLACDKWFEAHITNGLIDPGSLILYHYTSMVLHADMELLQRFFLQGSRQKTSIRNHENIFTAEQADVEKWANSSDGEVAAWHADCLMSRAEQVVHRQQPQMVGSEGYNASLKDLEDRQKGGLAELSTSEGPHFPYGVFFATLILCCKEEGKDRTVAANHLNRGRQVLLRFRLSIAYRLSRVLGYS